MNKCKKKTILKSNELRGEWKLIKGVQAMRSSAKLSRELFLRQMLPAKETREREQNLVTKALQKSPCS